MSIETFRNALLMGDSESTTLGGGEPTLHPMFAQMLFEAIGNSEWVWLATNGSQTETALTLAKLAKKGVIACALSRDIYHDPIDDRVIKAFERPADDFTPFKHKPSSDCREIRDVTGKEIKAGRMKLGIKGCVCPEMIVKPDGTIRACGCDDSPVLGNVNDVVSIPDDWEYGECYKNQRRDEQ